MPIWVWIGGSLALSLAGIFLWIEYRYRPGPSRRWVAYAQQIFSLQWFYRIIEILLRISVWSVSTLTGLLEGDGGILWVLVLLALLVAVLLNGGGL